MPWNAQRAQPDIQATKSRVVIHDGPTCLEVERFDRHGMFGRSPVNSLTTFNAVVLGNSSTDWTRLAACVAMANLLAPDDVNRIERLWWFGRLIANTDMHTGNLGSYARRRRALAADQV